MNRYKSKRITLLLIDMITIVLSFFLSFVIRNKAFYERFGNTYGMSAYSLFLVYALIMYVMVCMLKHRTRIERMTIKEVIVKTFEHQAVFIAVYLVMFFMVHRVDEISRIFVVLFAVFNVCFCTLGRLFYRTYCINRTKKMVATMETLKKSNAVVSEVLNDTSVKHVFCIGAKSLGFYGGFESFVLNLLQQHENNKNIQYHVACKASGTGCMEPNKLPGTVSINDSEFTYCNAHCVLIPVPEKLGSAQAIFYDIMALKWACDYIERNHIQNPIVYILASRIGPFEKKYVQRIHDEGGLVYQNPDGHEDWRAKWSLPIRKYWKHSERLAIKYADLVVCDSKSIEEYIRDEYSEFEPKTTFIAYGSHVTPSVLADDDYKYVNWLKKHDLKDREFYTVVGRFVPENNFETIIREFMLSNSTKDLAIITTDNPRMLKKLDDKLNFKRDKRIKFVGTVYDQNLLKKIRENAYGYFHGHSVGGTNPSLLEALGSTKLNLLYDVGFNREVAEDAAFYWSLDEGNLATLINTVDRLDTTMLEELGQKSKNRIVGAYSWDSIADKYLEIFI